LPLPLRALSLRSTCFCLGEGFRAA